MGELWFLKAMCKANGYHSVIDRNIVSRKGFGAFTFLMECLLLKYTFNGICFFLMRTPNDHAFKTHLYHACRLTNHTLIKDLLPTWRITPLSYRCSQVPISFIQNFETVKTMVDKQK